MGRGQVVRHQVLVLAFGGSNPSAPAKKLTHCDTNIMQDIARFLDKDGLVTLWPKKRADKDLVLAYLAEKFEFGRSYHENEVNEILKQWHTFVDWPLLRRELFDQGYFDRDLAGTDYRRVK